MARGLRSPLPLSQEDRPGRFPVSFPGQDRPLLPREIHTGKIWGRPVLSDRSG